MRFQFKTSGSKRLTRSFEHGDVLAPVGWFTIFQDRAMNANTSDKSKNQNGVAGANPYMEGKPSNTLKKGTKTLITPAQIVATSPIQRMNSKSLRNEAIVTSKMKQHGAMDKRIDLGAQCAEREGMSGIKPYGKVTTIRGRNVVLCYEEIDSFLSNAPPVINHIILTMVSSIIETVQDDSLMYEYREDMQEHCIECMALMKQSKRIVSD